MYVDRCRKPTIILIFRRRPSRPCRWPSVLLFRGDGDGDGGIMDGVSASTFLLLLNSRRLVWKHLLLLLPLLLLTPYYS